MAVGSYALGRSWGMGVISEPPKDCAKTHTTQGFQAERGTTLHSSRLNTFGPDAGLRPRRANQKQGPHPIGCGPWPVALVPFGPSFALVTVFRTGLACQGPSSFSSCWRTPRPDWRWTSFS